jgi:hypothetical protein
LWSAPLPADAAGFKKGERPGENGVDTKQHTRNPCSRLTIRNSLLYGFNQPGQVRNMAALNLKDHVHVTVESCVFRDNEICFRVRGGSGDRGGAQVTIDNCAVYDSLVAIRAEEKTENLKVHRLGIGEGTQQRLRAVAGGTGAGYENAEPWTPPKVDEVMGKGLPHTKPKPQ